MCASHPPWAAACRKVLPKSSVVLISKSTECAVEGVRQNWPERHTKITEKNNSVNKQEKSHRRRIKEEQHKGSRSRLWSYLPLHSNFRQQSGKLWSAAKCSGSIPSSPCLLEKWLKIHLLSMLTLNNDYTFQGTQHSSVMTSPFLHWKDLH